MKKLFIPILILLIIMLTACTNTEKVDDNNLNIVTSFYPMYIATSNIIDGAENVSLKCLASPDVGCLHDYQLTVNDMITLESTDVFVINGGGMESFLDKAVSAYPELIIVNAGEGITYESIEHEHIELEDEEEENSHEEEENSHIWVSVSLYMQEVKNISDELIKIDPDNAEIYTKNTDEYLAKLEVLKDEMHEKLSNIKYRNIVTFHEAFDFFAEEFNLNIVAVVEREPGTSPSAGDIANIIDAVKEKDVNAIFTEPQYSKNAAITISNETNVPVYELDPVVTGEFEKDAYEKAMRNNLEVLMEALS